MISYVYTGDIYGEPYSPSTLVGVSGYTGRYSVWFLLSVLVYYMLWVGVQLPQGKYVSYSRGYMVVTVWYGVGCSGVTGVGVYRVVVR